MMELTDILQASPPLALAVALNVVGEALKRSPVPNWMLPLILPLLGALAYPFIAEAGKVNYEVARPDVLLGIYGFCIGAASVGLNQMFRQFLGRRGADAEVKPTEVNKVNEGQKNETD